MAKAVARPKVLVDLNVVLDVLQERQPHYSSSAKVWAAIEEGHLEGFVAAHSVTTLFYILNRHLSWTQVTAILHDLTSVFSIAKVDGETIQKALSFGWKDFEDGVQMAAAIGAGASFLITRNPKDFETTPVPTLRPAELPAILQTPS